ncbi:hypothetical protein SLS55_005858 [Diplodia seriata]|uniref:C6 transcription factor n=1 Tax=Diplodia seriata TaxID=420778 RepID=A0ABR3CHK0_9PEZI
MASFQRVSLAVQKNYATILVYCAILSELHRQKSGGGRLVQDAFYQLSRETLICVTDHLRFITKTNSFKWQLQFSPTYSALTIAFSAALALTLSKTHADVSREKSLIDISRRTSSLLSDYPNQKFHLMVESFLKRTTTRNASPAAQAAGKTTAAGTTPTATTAVTDTAPLNLNGSSHNTQVQAGAASEFTTTTGLFSPPATTAFPPDIALETILGLPAESWFLDPSFSMDGFNFDGGDGP